MRGHFFSSFLSFSFHNAQDEPGEKREGGRGLKEIMITKVLSYICMIRYVAR